MKIRFLAIYRHYRQPSKLQKMSLKQKKDAYDKLPADDKKDYTNSTVQEYLAAQDKVTEAKAAYDKAMDKVDDTKIGKLPKKP